GSVVLFSEAMMHGTALWKADHERRTLLFKYCVSQMAWSKARVLPPPDVPLTPRQQALLIEPADPHTFVPSLFSDGPSGPRWGRREGDASPHALGVVAALRVGKMFPPPLAVESGIVGRCPHQMTFFG